MRAHDRGRKFELAASRAWHREGGGVPLLVSPLVLREHGAGQVDVGVVGPGGAIVVVEAKSGGVLPPGQRRRLLRSCALLSSVFGRPSVLRLASPGDPPGFAKDRRPGVA